MSCKSHAKELQVPELCPKMTLLRVIATISLSIVADRYVQCGRLTIVLQSLTKLRLKNFCCVHYIKKKTISSKIVIFFIFSFNARMFAIYRKRLRKILLEMYKWIRTDGQIIFENSLVAIAVRLRHCTYCTVGSAFMISQGGVDCLILVKSCRRGLYLNRRLLAVRLN